jgi:putative ATPase
MSDMVRSTPLAARMRPRTLEEFEGQEHILGPGRLLRRAIQADQLSSVLFYGPPGVGKTTLAQIIANSTKAQFLAINAVLAGIKDIREAIDRALDARETGGRRTVLFIDEVHRFNKAQQDALLPHVENGILILIGATTENPYFEVNKALVSRSRIFELRGLGDNHVLSALRRAIADPDRGLGRIPLCIENDALDHLVRMAGGDARSALNALELAATTTPRSDDGLVHVNLSVAEESIQKRAVLYDKDGDAHYDTISAFIKSVRGSDPDAALYWLARMVAAGEDPRFLFRRMIILAAEDIGLADPDALRMVMSAAQAFDYVGLPEGQFHLAEACLYLATAPKSNSTFAFFEALKAVQNEGPAGKEGGVPDALKDASRDGADLGHGKGYLYPHAYRDHWVPQQYLPGGLQGRLFYEPSPQGYEGRLRETVQRHREAQWEAMALDAAGKDALALADRATDSAGSMHRPPGKSAPRGGWLERAAGVGSEVLRAVRERLFELSRISRESLVLDLSGGTGFLTWEALRRARGGGVYTRCESTEAKTQLEGFARRLETFSQPVLLVAPLISLAERLREEKEVPRFDAVLGLDVSMPGESFEAWVDSILPFLAPAATLTLAYKQSAAQQVESLLPARQGSPKWVELIEAVQSKLDTSVAMSARMDALQAALGERAKVSWETRQYAFPRRFTPAQANALLESEGSQGQGLFGLLRGSAGAEWPALRAALFTALTSQEAKWHYGYGFLNLTMSG